MIYRIKIAAKTIAILAGEAAVLLVASAICTGLVWLVVGAFK